MKVTVTVALSGAALLFGAGPAGAADSCVATCNTANMQCQQAGKNDTVCLNAWHQCKTGCANPSPAKLKVTRPSPGTVVIKASAPSQHR